MKKNRYLIIGVIIVIGLGLIFSPLKPVKNILFNVFSPINSTLNNSTSGIRSFLSDLRAVRSLASDNRKLKEENNTLKSKIITLEEANRENETLKKELGYLKDQNKDELVTARVISKSVTPFLQSILIDQGMQDGIKEGQIVMSQGYLVGTVVVAYPDYSEVELITSSKTIIPVLLQNSRSTGLLKSNLEGLYIDNIPIDQKVQEGENVITNNLDKNIPANIAIGNVSKVKTYKSQIFQDIKVNSPLEFSKLEFVFVVKSS